MSLPSGALIKNIIFGGSALKITLFPDKLFKMSFVLCEGFQANAGTKTQVTLLCLQGPPFPSEEVVSREDASKSARGILSRVNAVADSILISPYPIYRLTNKIQFNYCKIK